MVSCCSVSWVSGRLIDIILFRVNVRFRFFLFRLWVCFNNGCSGLVGFIGVVVLWNMIVFVLLVNELLCCIIFLSVMRFKL